MINVLDETLEIRLRGRIAKMENILNIYARQIDYNQIDSYRNRIVQLELALIDAVFLNDGGDPASALVKRGLSAARAGQIVSLAGEKFS